jgi:amino acid transporter
MFTQCFYLFVMIVFIIYFYPKKSHNSKRELEKVPYLPNFFLFVFIVYYFFLFLIQESIANSKFSILQFEINNKKKLNNFSHPRHGLNGNFTIIIGCVICLYFSFILIYNQLLINLIYMIYIVHHYLSSLRATRGESP